MKNNSEKIYYRFDASGKILGRFASEVANVLIGKDDVQFMPNIVANRKVVVFNANEIKVSGNKELSKQYHHYSGFHGGLKSILFKDIDKKRAVQIAVMGMLPKNRLRDVRIKNLIIYNEQMPNNLQYDFIN